MACPQCDLLQRLPALLPGTSARCPRCNHELWRRRTDSLNRTLALGIAAALLYAVANVVPMLGLTVAGHAAFTTVFGGALQLWNDGQEIVAGLVLFAAVLAPGLQIGFVLAIIIGARRAEPPRWVGMLLRHLPATRTWSMIEVMMLGVLVALIKIAELATVIPGLALFVLGALVFLLAGIQASFDPREVWERITWADRNAQRVIPNDGLTSTAMQRGWQSCEVCGLLSRPAPHAEEGCCPRCGEELVFRKSDSLQRTWAFVIAAALCYVPANLLPVLTTTRLTRNSRCVHRTRSECLTSLPRQHRCSAFRIDAGQRGTDRGGMDRA